MKNIQWVAVSVCFVLAVTLWFLVTLNKQTYTTSFDVPVKLVNFPDNYQLLHDFPKEMHVSATGPGIKLLYQDFTVVQDTVTIDFDGFKDKNYFSSDNNLRIISQALKDGITAIAASPDTINLEFAVKANKRIAVKLDLEFDLPPSFRIPPQGLRFTDSVLVVGPLDSLTQITEVKTVHYKLPKSVEPQDLFIPLDSMGAYQLIPSSIRLRYTPRPYTERIVHLPVRAVGVPTGSKINFNPDSVEVKLLLPLERFELVQSGLIHAEVAYNHIDPRSNYVIPNIVNLPADVELVSFFPQMLGFLIITQE